MELNRPDSYHGNPALELHADEIETVVDLICRGSHEARRQLTRGMSEPNISRVVRKSMIRAKRTLGTPHVQIQGEHELDDMDTSGPQILGRVDITLRFRHQFSDENAYVAVECKRVGAGDNRLNGLYVTEGVSRFTGGQYSKGHAWAFMLGYVIALPASEIIEFINRKISKTYGIGAELQPAGHHPCSLAIRQSELLQGGGHGIRLMHVFVDMCTAAN